jgi:xylulokinase
MLMETLLGLDAGTTSVKAALFDCLGNCLGIAREEYQLSTPSAEQAELDTEIYWQASVKAIRAAIAQAGVDPSGVRAVSVSSQGETTITLDAHGRPLRPALVWLDNRASSQAERLAAQFDAQVVYETTGITEILPAWTACKIMWIKENEPVLFAQARKFLLVKDYLVYRLSGEYTTEGSIACTSLLYDIRRHAWWLEMLDAVGITPGQLPAITTPGGVAGHLSRDTASLLGMRPETLVINGGMDQATGAIGAGSVSSDIISETTGAAMAVQVTTPLPDMRSGRRIALYAHSLPGLYLYVPTLPTGGMSFKWFRDVFGEAELQAAAANGQDAYDLLTALAAPVAAGSDGLVMLPYLMGSFSPEEIPTARGVFSGFTLRHGRGHFVRAILEGVAFNLRHNLEVLGEAGLHFSELRSSGGGARSMLWNQIKADVCGLPVLTMANNEAALLGDAILAALACGMYSSAAEACASMVAVQDRLQPGPARFDYEKAYRRYIELNTALVPYFRVSYSGV